MRLEIQALAGRVGSEKDAQRVLRRVGVEPALDFLAPRAACEPVDDLDTFLGAFAALNRLFENRLQVALRALPILAEDEDAAIGSISGDYPAPAFRKAAGADRDSGESSRSGDWS